MSGRSKTNPFEEGHRDNFPVLALSPDNDRQGHPQHRTPVSKLRTPRSCASPGLVDLSIGLLSHMNQDASFDTRPGSHSPRTPGKPPVRHCERCGCAYREYEYVNPWFTIIIIIIIIIFFFSVRCCFYYMI